MCLGMWPAELSSPAVAWASNSTFARTVSLQQAFYAKLLIQQDISLNVCVLAVTMMCGAACLAAVQEIWKKTIFSPLD